MKVSAVQCLIRNTLEGGFKIPFKSHDAWEWFMFTTCCQRAQSNTKTMEHNSTNQLSIVLTFALTVWHSKMHIHCILPSRPFKPSQKITKGRFPPMEPPRRNPTWCLAPIGSSLVKFVPIFFPAEDIQTFIIPKNS